MTPGARLRAEDYRVRPCSRAEVWRTFTRHHHYSGGSSPIATYQHGLYRALDGATLLGPFGVALWVPPTIKAAKNIAGADYRGVLALSRLAVEPGMPTNSASFLLGRSMRLIDRKRWPVLVTYADTRLGHSGAIYLATNWRHDGEEVRGTQWVTPEGRLVGTQSGIRGRSYTRAEMEDRGCLPVEPLPKIRFVHDIRRKRG